MRRDLPSAPHRVLVMDLGGLGDNVHSLPALWLIRQQWPRATLAAMVNAHVSSLLALAPWIDESWPYSRALHRGVRGHWQLVRMLRTRRFDVVVDLKCTDRSSLLARATGAPVRLGREPADGGPAGWRHLFTRVMREPYYLYPMYWQKWRCLHEAGFGARDAQPEFHVLTNPALRASHGITRQHEGSYVHLSPCTTSVARELANDQLVALVDALQRALPGLAIVLSCSSDARERAKVVDLAMRLTRPPWKVFAGSLDIPALAAVIETAALNLSGDTGSLHLAMMLRTPAVAWFRAHRGEKEWIPHGEQYRALIAPGGAPDALHGIATEAIVSAARDVICSPRDPLVGHAANRLA